MRVKHLFDKRVAVVLMTAAVALGVSSCAPPASSTPGSSAPSDVGAIVQAMNQDRAAAGLGSLGYNDQLAASGANWASSIAAGGSLVHQNLSAILAQPSYSGYHTIGENLLVGPDGMSAGAMESAWMNSPGHRANILGAFSTVGVGIAHSGGRIWVAVEFGG